MGPYAKLAKKSVEWYVGKGEVFATPEELPDEMLSKTAGVFVTLRKNKALRGCIGTPLPSQPNIAEEIIQNAAAAATEDYRFGPVREEELPLLSYEVSVLTALEQVKNVKALNPKKYGILIKTISPPIKSALLLPDLGGINTPEKQIAAACGKSGINPKKEGILIYKFSVQRYGQQEQGYC